MKRLLASVAIPAGAAAEARVTQPRFDCKKAAAAWKARNDDKKKATAAQSVTAPPANPTPTPVEEPVVAHKIDHSA